MVVQKDSHHWKAAQETHSLGSAGTVAAHDDMWSEFGSVAIGVGSFFEAHWT